MISSEYKNIELKTGAVMPINQYKEQLELKKKDNIIVFALYMFSMEGCPPCLGNYKMLFGQDPNDQYNVWNITVKKFHELLPKFLEQIIENSLENFANDNSNQSIAYIYDYLNNTDLESTKEKRLKILIDFVLKNLMIVFVPLDRIKDQNTVSKFNISGFPSYTFCADSILLPESIQYLNNKIPVRCGSFADIGEFSRYFYSSLATMIEGVILHTIIPRFILEQTNNY